MRIDGPELDDLAHQAAADALLAITGKLTQFRGDSRFTTWAYKFVIFEVSGKLAGHFWRGTGGSLDAEDWDRLPDRFALDPERESEWHELVVALRRAVDDDLTSASRDLRGDRAQRGPTRCARRRLGSNRKAIYKSLFDARRKLRARLVAGGHLDLETARRP